MTKHVALLAGTSALSQLKRRVAQTGMPVPPDN
jgi:hypothetical protein